MQHIPLVLETPSFELPETVWKMEVEVLNRLSGVELGEDGEDEVLQEMTNNVKSAVQDAEKASGKTGKTRKTKSGPKKGKIGTKQANVDEDEDSEA